MLILTERSLYLVVCLFALLDLDPALSLQRVDLHDNHFATDLFLLVDVVRAKCLSNEFLDLIKFKLSLRDYILRDLLVIKLQLADVLQLLDICIYLSRVRLLEFLSTSC